LKEQNFRELFTEYVAQFQEKTEIVHYAFRSYIKWIKELSEKLGISGKDFSKIFEEEMNQPKLTNG